MCCIESTLLTFGNMGAISVDTTLMLNQPGNLAGYALEALPVAVLLTEPDGEIRARNRVAAQFLPPGDTLQQVLRCDGPDGVGPDWSEELAEIGSSGEPMHHANLPLEGEQGSTRLVDVHLSVLDGEVSALLVMVEDVTARVSMERRLATSERLAAVGKLAAQVAHELNTPLDGLLRYVGLAQRVHDEAGDGEKLTHYLQQARSGATRMATIIGDLLNFSRSAGQDIEHVPLRTLIDQAIEAMSPAMAAVGVGVLCDLDAGASCAVAGNLFQVFCNLMKNAADAMSSSGRLTITCRCRNDEAVITFADTGEGFDEQLSQRIFEPFFSTKPRGKGTGLGLSICRSIVQRTGGTIQAANGAGGGAVLTVRIPVTNSVKPFTESPSPRRDD